MTKIRIRSPLVVFIHDLIMVGLAWFGAYWLRFNLESIPPEHIGPAQTWFPLVLVCQGVSLYYSGLYRGHWRFASMPDFIRIIKAVIFGTLSAMVLMFLATRLVGVPRSVFPLYSVLLVGFLGLPRLLYRWHKDRRLYLSEGKRVLIVGSGHAGDMLARDLLRDPSRALLPVAFVDDKRHRRGMEIQGIRVLGDCEQIPHLVKEHDIALILIAIPSANSKQMQRIVGYCEQAAVPFRTLPRFQDLVAGRVSVDALRDVAIDDLLGREPIKLDESSLRHGCSGKKVLVTGGGGSIGSELCRQVLRFGACELIVFEQSEYNLYSIEQELRQEFRDVKLHALLGDVSDSRSVNNVFQRYRPQLVLHAAAYKHVPLLQYQAREAAENNIIGTMTVARAALKYAAETFVLVSTDKAVNPANIMGATKRVAEIFCQNLVTHDQHANTATKFITVRFGNVLGSAGSVVPLFKKQIEAGGPVTVTHPKMIRYFMTIPEACQLILQAGVLGAGGEIFVLDMGEPVNITYLAEQMIRLSGRKPGQDIEIIYTGLRPGEKLFEELFHEKELSTTAHAKILLAASRPMDKTHLKQIYRALEEACNAHDEPAIIKLIQELVPEMQTAAANLQSANIIPFGSKVS